MILRYYNEKDIETLAELFYNTVHTVNAADYTEEELNAWATGRVDTAKWNAEFTARRAVVATENGVTVGFADMDESGYLDRLYVHKDYQGRGIGRALVEKLEKEAIKNGVKRFETHASITAEGFFNARSVDVPVFEGITSVQNFSMIPVPLFMRPGEETVTTYNQNTNLG